jgi:transposase
VSNRKAHRLSPEDRRRNEKLARLRAVISRESAALAPLRYLTRRTRSREEKALDHERAIRAIVRTWRPDLLELLRVGPIVGAPVLTARSHPGR